MTLFKLHMGLRCVSIQPSDTQPTHVVPCCTSHTEEEVHVVLFCLQCIQCPVGCLLMLYNIIETCVTNSYNGWIMISFFWFHSPVLTLFLTLVPVLLPHIVCGFDMGCRSMLRCLSVSLASMYPQQDGQTPRGSAHMCLHASCRRHLENHQIPGLIALTVSQTQWPHPCDLLPPVTLRFNSSVNTARLSVALFFSDGRR